MPADYVLPLDDPQATVAVAGGKGASLARLAAAGLPGPGGFHVTTAAYKQFVAANDLQKDILAAVAAVNVAEPATLEAAARTIHDLFMRAATPCLIADAIARAYASLGDNPAVAVRSSATAEDLPELSFAGQQESFLNVRGPEAVLQAVKKCWASLWTARAIGYRAQHGVGQDAVSMAVVLQLLVRAEAAGVLFTADPMTGKRDQAMITAAWGLGESVVGGLVTPDTVTVDKSTGRILRRDTADKQVMTVRSEEGTREQPTPAELRHAPVLSDDDAAELVRLGMQIEPLYGLPMDIEWARADGKFLILQARPITALPPPESAVPTQWKLPGKGPFFRGSIVDFLADPLSPLFATLGRSRYNASHQRLMAWFVGDPDLRMSSLVTINGYGYMSMEMNLRAWLKMLPALTRMPQVVRTAIARWQGEAVPRYTATVARWRARPLPGLPAAELLTGVCEIFDVAMDHLTTLQSGIMGMAGSAEAALSVVYNKLIRRPGDPEAAAFVMGYDSKPILADKALYDLALWCRAQPRLAEYVQSVPAKQLATDLSGPQAPRGLDDPGWRELQTRWLAHVDQYGAMIYSLDFARPLPCDEPAPLLETLKLYVNGQGQNPYERQQKLAARREAAVNSMLARLKGWRRKLFRTVLGWGQEAAPLREDGIAFIGYGYPQLRRLLQELGRRLAQAGAVQQADDIFWLTEGEVRAGVAALDRGQATASLKDLLQQRRAEWQAQKRLTPPPTLPPMRKFLGIPIGQWLPARGEDQVGDTLKGVAASAGKVTAPACVLHGPEDFDRMRPGSVLVAEITTPAWTPLIAMASAVVTDIGGPLSHGSIVAREYSIPAVMGTGVATRRIHSGQMITVDGSAGAITLAKN